MLGTSIVLTVLACAGAVGLLLAMIVIFTSGVVVYIPNNKAGIVERVWSSKGSVKTGFIALNGEAGFQPDILRGGWHFFAPFVVRVHKVPLVTIPQGRIGYVFARDGESLPTHQTLASNAVANDFEDVRSFLANGGQRGPQRRILREGTFAIHLGQFAVLTSERNYFLPLDPRDTERFETMSDAIDDRKGFTPVVLAGESDMIGIVTVHDGPSLHAGEIIAPVVGEGPGEGFHDHFQDPEKFVAGGGRRGRQLQVLTDGTWYINRLFATVETVPKTVVSVGFVGVVVNYTGERGRDLSGDHYSHGELVGPGERGVWSEALMPGKYAFNPYAAKVIQVPTTNIILKWIRNQAGAHGYDANLAEVSLITKDAFEPSLPLSVVVHIDYRQAPLVVQRFGDIQRLVEQTLDPMVAAYFKNVGQTRTLIQLVHERASIQDQASSEMRAKFARYNLELEEVLIGTPSGGADNAIEEILQQLRQRQIAVERTETYKQQEHAAFHERTLREAQSRAAQQARITESELQIDVASNEGKATYQRSVQQAQQVRVLATAEADKVRLLAEAEAERISKVGVAQALATEEQVRAFGGPQYQVATQISERLASAIATAKVDLVPRVVVGGGANGAGGQGNLVEAMLSMLLSDKLGEMRNDAPTTPRSPEAEAMRVAVKSRLLPKPQAA